MQHSKLKSGKKEPKQYITENPFESLLGVGKGVVDSLKEQAGKDAVYDAWDSIINKAPRTHEGHGEQEMHAGEEVDINNHEKNTHKEAGNNYHRDIIHTSERSASYESREVAVKVQEILIEIKQLANSSAMLKKKIDVVAIEQMGENPGKYQLNFLEQMLTWIREARMTVEDSLAWFSALRSKKAARQYGSLAKKHGASFMLSGERAPVTQTG